ncbi:hypothetical protein CGS59_05440 [Faecalibacterium prausnitzii]|uniref:Uncharacterized protein n=1 Tax=Faecalibacterium prausnitzii TaxID=853 RepID=A0A2A7AZ14_9FIRM|nr:hypothetical protein CGS59_05440 [Faecalibacterium prausnitzii]
MRIKNKFSTATTTTAASGGNREELLGQRPARCECRPRHDADAGCRNPEGAARIQNVPAFARFAETFRQSLAHLPIDSAPQQRVR